MQNTSTLHELLEFTKNEKSLLKSVGLKPIQDEDERIDKSVVDSLLNYSLSLSVRKSKILNEDYILNFN